MEINFFNKAETFYRKHPDSKKLLLGWSKRIQLINPKHFFELRETFPTFPQADQVGELTVFNISRNYRLIARINYKLQELFIIGVFLHEEYDRDRWKS